MRLAQIDFGGSEFGPLELAQIEQQAQLILGDSLGGSNGRAVAFSYEMLSRAEGGVLAKASVDIAYNGSGQRTTYLVMVDSVKIGVLVTRAYAYPPDAPYTIAQAQTFLTTKLQDIALSTANVSEEDAWQKQVLHVFTPDEMHVLALVEAYGLIDAATKADTIVYITRTDGADGFLYQ